MSWTVVIRSMLRRRVRSHQTRSIAGVIGEPAKKDGGPPAVEGQLDPSRAEPARSNLGHWCVDRGRCDPVPQRLCLRWVDTEDSTPFSTVAVIAEDVLVPLRILDVRLRGAGERAPDLSQTHAELPRRPRGMPLPIAGRPGLDRDSGGSASSSGCPRGPSMPGLGVDVRSRNGERAERVPEMAWKRSRRSPADLMATSYRRRRRSSWSQVPSTSANTTSSSRVNDSRSPSRASCRATSSTMEPSGFFRTSAS